MYGYYVNVGPFCDAQFVSTVLFFCPVFTVLTPGGHDVKATEDEHSGDPEFRSG